MYTVYVLKSLRDGKTYLGCTKDFTKRLQEHNTGKIASVKMRRPFTVWYTEHFTDKFIAFRREKHFKSAWGRRQLRKILNKL